MLLTLTSLLYAICLLLAANHDLRANDARLRTAVLSLGLTQMHWLWATVGKLISRLNPLDQPKYDYGNPLHRAAALLVLAQMAWSSGQLLSPPGESVRNSFPAELNSILFNLLAAAMLYVAISLLGTGWTIRRDLHGILRRLGLRPPTRRDWLAGLAAGILIFTLMTLAASALPSRAGDGSEARLLFDIAKRSLPAALLVAILSSTGEEILFRGALQPVFGLTVTSLLFALVHVQYGLSFELLILFFVSLGFGLARKRYSTTAAIVCHATYNFAPFLLYRLLPA